MKIYQVVAQVTRTSRDGKLTTSVPTFYLLDHVSGIVNNEHAEIVARHMLESLATDAEISVSISQGEMLADVVGPLRAELAAGRRV